MSKVCFHGKNSTSDEHGESRRVHGYSNEYRAGSPMRSRALVSQTSVVAEMPPNSFSDAFFFIVSRTLTL
jgi:hypothetical protein